MQTYSPGTRIGQYEIASRPMMGGMGVVYFALDHGNDGRPVALKTFRPELLPDRAARDRFLREGTAWVELGSHLHIVRCYEVKYIDPTAFLVLELIAKEQNLPDASLRSWLIPAQSLSIEQALLFALQITRGMQYATEKIPGFVHRDLKPENILVGVDRLPGTNINRLRVTDFGLAKAVADGGVEAIVDDTNEFKLNHIQFTRGVGTPLYMAPEQWQGEPVSESTDVYALGCILYEMLTGQRAATGQTIGELQTAHCTGKLGVLPETLPKDVALLITKCLKLLSSERYISWNDLTASLESAYTGNTGQSVPQLSDMDEMSQIEQVQLGRSYNAIGLAYVDMSKVHISLGYFEQAISIAHQIGDHSGEAAALSNLGEAYRTLGDSQSALRYFDQSLTMARETHNRRQEGKSLGNLGLVHLDHGDARQTIGFIEQSLTINREIGDRQGESTDLGNLGVAYFQLGKIEQAIQYYEQRLAIVREINDRHGEGETLGNLGTVYSAIGNMPRAIDYYSQRIDIAREIGDRRGEGAALANLGITYSKLGEDQRAISYFDQALNIANEIGDRYHMGGILNNIGTSYRAAGETAKAIEHFERAQKIAREIQDRQGEANALGNIGMVYKDLGDARLAIRYYKQCLEILQKIGDRRGEGILFGNLATANIILGDDEQAIEYFEKAISIGRQIGDIGNVATNMLNMAKFYLQKSDAHRALPLAQEAFQIFSQINHPAAKLAQALVSRIQGNSPTELDPVEASFYAFQGATSIDQMRLVTAQYPFILDHDFIAGLEKMVAKDIPSERKPAFEQRLAWLKQIAGEQKSGFIARFFGKKR